MIVERKTHIPEDIDDDCISRKEVLALATELSFDGVKGLEHWKCNHIDPLNVMKLPPIPPKKVCVAEVKVSKEEVEELISKQIKDLIAYAENGVNGNDDA